MIDVSLEINVTDIERRLGAMANKASLVMARAANRSATTGKKVIKQETSKKYMVQMRDVEGVLKVTRANSKYPFVKLVYKDNHKNLYCWSKRGGNSVVTPNVPISYDGDGTPLPKVYHAHVVRNQGVKELGGSRKPFVQIAKRSGNIALFRRVDDTSRKIVGVAGPALPQIIGNEEVMKRFEKETSEMLLKRLEHEVNYELSKGV